MIEYKDMLKKELWVEIVNLVNTTHFTETDKSLFLELIQEYSNREWYIDVIFVEQGVIKMQETNGFALSMEFCQKKTKMKKERGGILGEDENFK